MRIFLAFTIIALFTKFTGVLAKNGDDSGLVYELQAKHLNLAFHPQWLALHHYHRSFWGSYQSKLPQTFFLSREGEKDPEKELAAALIALFPRSPLQCRYPAQTRFFINELQIKTDDIVTCPKQIQWKKNLGADEISIVFAATDMTSIASAFGHVFLKVHNTHNPVKSELVDYGISFAATTGEDTGGMIILKGLTGLYKGNYSMLPYHQRLKDYSNIENRDIWEYKLNLTPPQIEMILNHLLELEGHQLSYSFLSTNCSSELIELLNVGLLNGGLSQNEPIFNSNLFFIPIEGIFPFKPKIQSVRWRPSLFTDWIQKYKTLSSLQKNQFQQLIVEKNMSIQDPQVLDSALDYLSFAEATKATDIKLDPVFNYQLQVIRSQKPILQNPIELHENSLYKDPLQGPAPQYYYVSAGQKNISTSESSPSTFLGFKSQRAYHDILSPANGTPRGSHFETLSFDFEVHLNQNSKNLQVDLRELHLIHIISRTPLSIFNKEPSWRFDLGAEKSWRPFILGGLGPNLPEPLPNISLMLTCKSTSFSNNHWDWGLGLDILWWVELTPSSRMIAQHSYTQFQHHPIESLDLIELSNEIFKNQELRLKYKMLTTQVDRISEIQIQIARSF